MCAVSMVLDRGMTIWPTVNPYNPITPIQPIIVGPGPTRQEFEELKRAVEAAKEVDRYTGQPDCELDEKLEWYKKLEERVKALESERSIPTPEELRAVWVLQMEIADKSAQAAALIEGILNAMED